MMRELISCPDCGHVFTPGSVIINGEVLDPAVESGVRLPHEALCPGRDRQGQGLFQQTIGTWGQQ